MVSTHSLPDTARRPLTSLAVLLLLLVALPAWAQGRVDYEIAFPNSVHHEAEITATFSGLPENEPAALRMSRTSPGRYALHEFAKNVYNVRAADGAGRSLTLTRPSPYQWNAAGHDGTVRVTYTLFGDHADGTYAGINSRYGHLNIPATFMWARGMEEAPVRVAFRRPQPDWTIATQLFPTDDPEVFTAPNFWYFMDSPTHLGELAWRSWDVRSNGKTYSIRLAVHHDGTDDEVNAYAEMAEEVVAEQVALWGEVPDFEPGTYTFIAVYLPSVHGDGMEHRNSTILTSTGSLAGDGKVMRLGTLSHEFFHAWNVERLRPRSLEPFDFEEANMSDVLWFAEGFTSYYTPLFIRRAGIIDDEAFAEQLSGMLDPVINGPGRQFFSPVEMSMQAPFVDAATSVDAQNRQNTFISYYTWGSAVGLGLDLTLRGQFGQSLGDYMRAMWAQYGKPERPYALADLKRVLGEVTGDAAFARDFFARYIEGREVVDYARLLAQAGMLLRKAHEGRVWLGAPVVDEAGRAVVAAGPLIGSPLYAAGLDQGAVLISLDGQPVPGAQYVEGYLASCSPSTAVTVVYEQHGEERTAVLQLTQDPALEVVLYEQAGQPVTEAMRAFRQAWLDASVPGRP